MEVTTLGNLADSATRTLAAASDSPRLDAELLLAEAAGVSRSTIIAFPERLAGTEVRDTFEQLVEQRRAHVPIAYLLGQREFFSLTLEVRPGVLVPRPETELIVETALELIPEDGPALVLDLGTGSGAIALAIKHERSRANVIAVDSSKEALVIARRNAATLGLDVQFMASDWFSALEDHEIDVIVANPPYVRSDDPALAIALRHEPAVALDGGRDGLDAVRLIVANAIRHLTPGGYLLVEHGDYQGDASRALAEQAGYRDVRTLADLAGRDRVLAARAP
ncbi:MAG: peptide chain release factor N(5)-glutamine methyltransferase [Gammaproteobacteria bacterium]|nr:peptide chain release factor N(5)-glutamine methyltransferase [Gammaproteobacteria bacterium]MDH3505842.1 peptide chain release factor N(5)-glutamine methyltransferase [Gammaproteobacteria bacterium]